jgi:hypothetical protein
MDVSDTYYITHQVLKILLLREGERLLAQVLPHHVNVQEILAGELHASKLHAIGHAPLRHNEIKEDVTIQSASLFYFFFVGCLL